MGSGRNTAGLAVGVGTLLVTASLARRPLSGTEVAAFTTVNHLPDRPFPMIWGAMQYGTYGTVPATSGLALVARHPRLALALAAGGTAAWVSAKGVKQLIRRGRPDGLVVAVAVRGTEERGLGFPSGHAAVSAALTVVAWGHVPRRWRPPLLVLTGIVPLARMYVGAHLPLDVVGGSGLGVAVGSLVNIALGTGRR